jgi:hypothetical protein
MAVYTDVAAEDLAEFLKGYDIGELLSYKGIAEGVENSNFLLHTSKGAFILTLYEKRVAVDDLPYFLSLMAHLAERGVRCPQPARNRKGEVYSELAGRPAAIINFLEGVWPRRPNAAHCTGVGAALAKMHLAGRDFPMFRKNPLSVEGWRPLFDLAAPRADGVHRRDGAQLRTAGPERGLEMAPDAALDGDGEVDAEASVGRAGFQFRREALRQVQADATVHRLDVEAGAIPVVAVDVDRDAAVGGLAAEIAADVGECEAAVLRVELRGASEVVDRNAAVVRVQREHRVTRHVDLEADVPVLFAVHRVGAFGVDAAARCVDAHGGDEAACVGVGGGGCLDLAADQYVAAIPAADTDAAVAPRVDVERVGAADGVLAHLTVRDAVVVVVAIVAGQDAGPRGGAVLGLGRSRGNEGRGDSGSDKSSAKHQASSARLDGKAAAGVYCPNGRAWHTLHGRRAHDDPPAEDAHGRRHGSDGGRRRPSC